MLRSIASTCKTNLKSYVFTKSSPGLAIGIFRMNSTAVQDASEEAKREAKRALDEVTSVLGNHKNFYHEPDYNSPEFIEKYVKFFNRPNIDSWEIRRAIQDFTEFDFVPDPEITIAVLKGCRRLNDFALAIRYLELVKEKCANEKTFYPYILREIRPTLDELGINTPDELGFDKPELTVKDVDDIH